MSDRPDISPWEYGKTYETMDGRQCEIIGRDSKGNLVWVVHYDGIIRAWNSEEAGTERGLYPKEPERTVDQMCYLHHDVVVYGANPNRVSVMVRWTIGSDGGPAYAVRLDADGKPLYRLEQVEPER